MNTFALGAVALAFMLAFMPAASLDTVAQNVYEEMASGEHVGDAEAPRDAMHPGVHRRVEVLAGLRPPDRRALAGIPIAFALGAVALAFMLAFMPAASLDTVAQNVYGRSFG
jgi:hypothetical protein